MRPLLAGALMYTKYNWIMKRIMRAISRRAGVDTDIKRDYEYTNWEEVKRFAHALENLLTIQPQTDCK